MSFRLLTSAGTPAADGAGQRCRTLRMTLRIERRCGLVTWTCLDMREQIDYISATKLVKSVNC